MLATVTAPRRHIRPAKSASGKSARLVATLGTLLIVSGMINLSIILVDGGLQ